MLAVRPPINIRDLSFRSWCYTMRMQMCSKVTFERYSYS